MTPAEPVHRAGFVALLGPPNAGKSTLLNRVLGEKLAIVTAKPQTTRSRILGILSRPGAQMMFVDTPGLHASTKRLNAALNDAVAEAAKDCDAAVLVVDALRGWQEAHDELVGRLQARGVPFVVALNKMDRCDDPSTIALPLEALGDATVVPVSARSGEGVDGLLDTVVDHLPESPALYPDDELTDRPVRWLCAELIREAAFEKLDQELPYSVAVEVVRFDESDPDRPVIHANLLVARDSQKRIVVGRGGRMVKAIGSRARARIERLLGTRVHLALFVKVDPRWLESAQRIEELGYR